MQKKILISIFEFRDFPDSFMRACNNAGYDVRVCAYNIAPLRSEYFIRFRNRYLNEEKRYVERKIKEYNYVLMQEANEYKPDVIIVINSNAIYRKTLELLKCNCKLVLYLLDPISTIPDIMNNIDLFDNIYSYLSDDVQQITNSGFNADILHPGCDEEFYHHIDCEKEIDVAFVGAGFYRYQIVKSLVRDLKNIKFSCWGEFIPGSKVKDRIAHTLLGYGHSIHNTAIGSKEVNDLYNKSRLILNIPSPQNVSGWSSRLPEIAATKTMQLIKRDAKIEEYFHDNVVMYDDYNDLKNKIIYYLGQQELREKYANKLYNVCREHTITNNIKEIMNSLYNS